MGWDTTKYTPHPYPPKSREVIKRQCDALGLRCAEYGIIMRVESDAMLVTFVYSEKPAFYTDGKGIYDTEVFRCTSTVDGPHQDYEWFKELVDFFFDRS